MAYEKTNWQTGDVVTSTKLNKIEDGVSKAINIPDIDAIPHLIEYMDQTSELSYFTKADVDAVVVSSADWIAVRRFDDPDGSYTLCRLTGADTAGSLFYGQIFIEPNNSLTIGTSVYYYNSESERYIID